MQAGFRILVGFGANVSSGFPMFVRFRLEALRAFTQVWFADNGLCYGSC